MEYKKNRGQTSFLDEIIVDNFAGGGGASTGMERLTRYFSDWAHGAEGDSDKGLTGAYCRGKFEATAIVDRLAAIEDILGDTYDLDHLRELVEADREGRCVVFKFGIGSTVYRAWIRPDGSCPYISADIVRTVKDMLNAEEWDNAYHTYQEAEKALKECGKGVHNQNSG